MKKRIFIFGIFSLFVNINFLASENDDPEISKNKLVFLGDEKVGKSSIINRFVTDRFFADYIATIGLDFQTKEVEIDEQEDQKIRLLLYDTAGQEKFRSLIPIYAKEANIFLLVYDVTSKDSFSHLSNWFKDLTNVKKEEVIFAVVGNKTDLNDGREVSAEEGENYAKEHDFIFKEVSAKTGDGIKDLFDVILKEMLKKKPESLLPPQPQIIFKKKVDGKIEPELGEKDCCCCCRKNLDC